MRNYWKSDFLTHLSDDAIDLVVEEYPSVPAPHTHFVIEQMGGAVSRIGKDETAVSHRDAEYNAIVVGMWVDPLEDEQTIVGVKRSDQEPGSLLYLCFTCKLRYFRVEPRGFEPLTSAVQRRIHTIADVCQCSEIPANKHILSCGFS